ncbi:MAG: hypothetical protein Q7S02_06645, partial [bacterium]|nr:hypothetical protein [bacterium]
VEGETTMADQKQLFDKTMDVLREAFVRNRFGEAIVFGMHDIETWLSIQCKAGRPDPLWEQFLARNFIVMCAATSPIAHLRERATPYATRPGEQLIARTFQKLPDGVQYLLGALHVSPVVEGVYYGHSVGCIITYTKDGMVGSLLTIRSGTLERGFIVAQEQTNSPGAERLVVDILFAEWDRQNPKWKEARQFLYDAFGQEIKRERRKAEEDFDSAVAVSADGVKIWHADRVVVLSDDKQHVLGEFPSEAFHERKILLAPADDRCRVPTDVRPHLITAEVVEQMQRGEYGPMARFILSVRRAEYRNPSVSQALCNFAELLPEDPGLAQVLCTTERFCPSPLPDGGVEMTV